MSRNRLDYTSGRRCDTMRSAANISLFVTGVRFWSGRCYTIAGGEFMPILQTTNLTKLFGNRLIAVNGVNLTVEEGSVFGLLGPNGAGKTTLMKLLLGLQTPTAGKVEMFGQRMSPNAAHLRQ